MRLHRIVDPSIPLHAGTQVYPGDPKPELRSATRIETHGYNLPIRLGGVADGAPCRAVALELDRA